MKNNNKLWVVLLLISFVMIRSYSLKAQENRALLQATLQAEKTKQNWQADDVNEWKVSSQYRDAGTGITHAYVQQMYNGLPVYNAISIFAIKNNAVAHFKPGVVANVKAKASAIKATITPMAAIEATVKHLDLSPKQTAKMVQTDNAAKAYEYSSSELSNRNLKVQLMYVPTDKKLVLAYEVSIELKNEPHWWNVRIDATTGEFIDKNDWTVQCSFDGPNHHQTTDVKHAEAITPLLSPPPSPTTVPLYNVFAFPLEAPTFGTRSLLSDPADYTSSPFGWHDVNGAAGAEYTITRGNNVYAYEDANSDNNPGFSPDGGAALNFDFPYNQAATPITNQSASITNLFYANNKLHDVLHHFGFTEAAGNFQQNNYGNGGLGNDYVLAEAFDGSGTNNANFSTPNDGSSGRMQMYLFNSSSPNPDGSFDNGIVNHEFGHGLSNRLTGGPGNSSCLNNAEQGGEGWSDWLALMLSIEPSDTGATFLSQARGIGTYALGQPTNGPGIRRFRYSTDMSISPLAYDNLGSSGSTGGVPRSTQVHNIGEIWCNAIWDMSCFLINDFGFNIDPTVASAGNNIAMRLVLEGMKLQPCQPGFLDARDAILLADHLLYNDAHCSRIWQAFARRGMGIDAVQGSSTNANDQVAGFTPYNCNPCTGTPEAGSAAANAVSVCAGSAFTVTLSGQSSGVGVNNQWQSSPNNLTWTSIANANGSFYTGSQNAATYYRCLVTCATSGLADSSNSVLIGQIANCIIISNHSDTTCNAAFYDSGGSGGNYGDNEFFVQTFVPTTVTGRTKIIWNSFVSETNYDFITIYDGPDTLSTKIYGPLSGTLNIPTFVSSHTTGALTVKFTSDISLVRAGWNALVLCDLPCNGPTAVGIDTLDICNGSSTTLTVTGGASGYTWSPATGLNQTTGLSVIASPTVSTIYTVTSDDDPTCKTTFMINVLSTPSSPTAGNYSICPGSTIPVGQGLTASTVAAGTFTTLIKFSGSPYSSSGPVTTVGNILLPLLPAGSVIDSAKLKLYGITALGASFRREFRAALSGAYTLAATGFSTLASAGLIAPDPELSLAGLPTTGGTVNLLLSETFDDAGVDATVDSAYIEITYTIPPSTITWWDAASGGTQLGTGSPFNPIGTVALPNSNTANNYTFYAQNNLGACGSIRTAAVLTIVATDDDDACTNDACDPATLVVTNTAVNCNDNNLCTTEYCDAVIGCVYTPVNTDDGIACTMDGCDPLTGVYHTPNGGGVITVGPITGNYTTSCLTLSSYTNLPYSIPAVAGATYIWTVPAGMTIASGQGTNSILVNATQSAIHYGIIGNVCVTVSTSNGCSTGNACTAIELEAVKPVSPGSITGAIKACAGDVITYTVASVSRATSYQWTLPANMSGTSTTNSITVTVLNGFSGGILSVKAGNICGFSASRTKNVAKNTPGLPAAIAGPSTGVCSAGSVTYSTTGATAATGYFWTVPSGATIVNGQGSASITVSFTGAYTTGLVTVKGTNGCGNGATRSLTVSGKPATPGVITGPTAVCIGQPYNYSVALVAGASTYTWLKPATATLVNQGSAAVSITYNTVANNQTISVKASNGCGFSNSRALTPVTVTVCTRINDGAYNSAISVYPNPAHNELSIALVTDKAAAATIALHDITGRVVQKENKTTAEGINNWQLNVQSLAKGIYLLAITTADKKETIKVVIE